MFFLSTAVNVLELAAGPGSQLLIRSAHQAAEHGNNGASSDTGKAQQGLAGAVKQQGRGATRQSTRGADLLIPHAVAAEACAGEAADA